MATDYELEILDPVAGGTITQLFDTINSNSKHIEDHALANGAITTAQLENGAVTASKLVDGAITTAKINNGAVTSDKIDTTSFKQLLLNYCYPVGSYYWSANNVSPANFLGGTWETVEGKMLFAAGSVQVTKGTYQKTFNFNQGQEGGSVYVDFSKSADVDANATMFSLVRRSYGTGVNVGYGGLVVIGHGANTSTESDKIYDGFYTDQGITRLTAPSNMPPYEVAYCWRRTA